MYVAPPRPIGQGASVIGDRDPSWLPIVVSDSHQDVLALGCVAVRLCVRNKEICEFFLGLGFHDLVTAMTRETQHWFSMYSDHPRSRVRSRRALPMTLTEDSAMAAAAIIGDSSHPNAG